MKKILWPLAVFMSCSLLLTQAEEEMPGEDSAAEEVPEKKPAKKAAPKKAPAKKADAKKAPAKKDAPQKKAANPADNILSSKVTIDSAAPAEAASKITAAVAQSTQKKVKLQIQLPPALQKDKSKKSYKLKNVPVSQAFQTFCKLYKLEYTLKGSTVTFKQPKAAPKKAEEKKEPVLSWRFIGPFRTGYQDNLRKSALYSKNLPEVQAALKKQKYNWNPKNIKGVTFSRKGNHAILIVTADENTLRQLQHALSKAFNNEVRTLTFVDQEDLTPAHFAAAKPPAPPAQKTDKKAPEKAEEKAEEKVEESAEESAPPED